MSRLLLVTPARNEAAHLERTIRAVVAQTRQPDLWLLIDDGSSDETPRILEHWAAEASFLRIVDAPTQADGHSEDRLAFAAEARAFNWALREVGLDEFTHIGKLDADIELPPEYFEQVLGHFSQDPELGIAGGTLLEQSGGRWRPTRVPSYHVRGALKLYSRECFEAIGGIEERLGWDTIDETYARMLGYATRSTPAPAARHHRPVATRNGTLRGRARHGQCAYILRYGFPWTLARSFKLATQKPYGLSGLAFLYGYLRGAARSEPKVEDVRFKRFVRHELWSRVLPYSSFFHPSGAD